MEFYVEWRIEVEADSPEEAARRAREIQQNPESTATVFHVIDEHGELSEMEAVDLTAIDEGEVPS